MAKVVRKTTKAGRPVFERKTNSDFYEIRVIRKRGGITYERRVRFRNSPIALNQCETNEIRNGGRVVFERKAIK